MGKICPLLLVSPARNPASVVVECQPDRCAWAYENGCAVTTIARCLDGMNEKGIITWIEEDPDNGHV